MRRKGDRTVLVLSHVGYTMGVARGVQRVAGPPRVHYWLVGAMSLLPDLVDRTLFLFLLPLAEGSRIIAHTLLFNAVLVAVLVAARRSWWIYGAASAFHLALDSVGGSLDPWARHVLWPLLGGAVSYIEIGTQAPALPIFVQETPRRAARLLETYLAAPLWYLSLEVGGAAIILAFAAVDLRALLRRRRRASAESLGVGKRPGG